MAVPKYDELFEPLLKAIRRLGGSASVVEQEDEVASALRLSEKDISEIQDGNRTKLSYRLAWARQYLKRSGLIENSAHGIWALTPLGSKQQRLDKEAIKRFVHGLRKGKNVNAVAEISSNSIEDQLIESVRNISPSAFERLCQRVLRESGFIQVDVTGRSGDGGIDGKGLFRIGGFLSFRVIFQCKRYKGSVGASVVRDFRGAMIGRADRGLIITTGSFSQGARTEAQRDGAPPIDLVDGEQLVEKLKQLRIGVDVRQRVVEEFVVSEEYFRTL